MAIMFLVRDRDSGDYSPRSPVWKKIQKKGVKVQLPKGSEIELFRINVLAKALDRTVDVLKEWEKKGYLPAPTFKISGDTTRYYTAFQVVNCHRVMFYRYGGKKYFHQDRTLFEKFVQDIRRVWNAKALVVNDQGEIQ